MTSATPTGTPHVGAHLDRAAPAPSLPAELVDGITDALVSASGRTGRAAVVAGLVEEIYASVAWLGPDGDVEELLSLRRLRDAVGEHVARVSEPLAPGRPSSP